MNTSMIADEIGMIHEAHDGVVLMHAHILIQLYLVSA